MDLKQFDELLKKRFDESAKAIEKRFDENTKELERRFDENAKIMLHEFSKIREDIQILDERVTKGVENIQKSVDAYAKRTDGYMQEMLALAHKVDRIERWKLQIAQETGIKLVA